MNPAVAPITASGRGILTLRANQEKRLRRRVRSWACGFLGVNDGEFEDAYQAAWLRVIEHLRSGRPVRNLEHFLRWEVGNSWKMELRRRQRRPSVPLGDCPEGALENCLSPDPAERVARRAELLELFESLETTRRQIVLLRNAYGHTPAEVCRLLGIARHAYREEHAEAIKELKATARGWSNPAAQWPAHGPHTPATQPAALLNHSSTRC